MTLICRGCEEHFQDSAVNADGSNQTLYFLCKKCSDKLRQRAEILFPYRVHKAEVNLYLQKTP